MRKTYIVSESEERGDTSLKEYEERCEEEKEEGVPNGASTRIL